jgi:antimicrobial peptide system SdpA family protein
MEDVGMDKSSADIGRLRVLGLLAVALVGSWSIVVLYVVHAALPFNPIRLPLEGSLRYFAPEGWAFFTRDPREERFDVFVRRAGVWTEALTSPHSRASNWFGLNRRSTAQGIEIGLLLADLPKASWQGCRAEAPECLAKKPPEHPIRNVSPEPTLCGEVGISLQKPVPWAWSRSPKRVIMPSRVARLRITC